MLNRISEILKDIKTDDDCRVVLFSSTGQHFCLGLDYLEFGDSEEDKKNITNSVYEIFEALITFPKPLIANIQGNVSGLGVMLLPLFDITFCSDKSIFETDYIKFEKYPEGYSAFSSISNNSLVSI